MPVRHTDTTRQNLQCLGGRSSVPMRKCSIPEGNLIHFWLRHIHLETLNIPTSTDENHLRVLMILFTGIANPQSYCKYASLVLMTFLTNNDDLPHGY